MELSGHSPARAASESSSAALGLARSASPPARTEHPARAHVVAPAAEVASKPSPSIESREDLDTAVEVANAEMKELNERIGFRVHDETGQIFVQVVDRHTGEVVRETPPEEFLDMMVRLKEMVGVFLDETT